MFGLLTKEVYMNLYFWKKNIRRSHHAVVRTWLSIWSLQLTGSYIFKTPLAPAMGPVTPSKRAKWGKITLKKSFHGSKSRSNSAWCCSSSPRWAAQKAKSIKTLLPFTSITSDWKVIARFIKEQLLWVRWAFSQLTLVILFFLDVLFWYHEEHKLLWTLTDRQGWNMDLEKGKTLNE